MKATEAAPPTTIIQMPVMIELTQICLPPLPVNLQLLP